LSAHGHRHRRCAAQIFARQNEGGTGRHARADNRQDYICSRVALTRTHATILSHISHSSTFRSSTRLITRYPRSLRCEMVGNRVCLLMSSYWLPSSPIQHCLYPAPQHSASKIRG
jgi:hypothetical protein